MMRKEVVLFLLVSVAITKSQNFIFSTPALSPAVKESSEGFSFFLSLWEYSLRVDGQSKAPSNRANLEPKTLLLPGDSSMATLVPQDAAHPLYLEDEMHSELRRKFILDHLIMNPFPKNDPALDSPNGLTEKTLSNKPVTIRRENSGDLYVEGVRVKKTVTLPDGSQIYVLERPLFNQTQIVRQAFNDLHQIPEQEEIGPPLDIPMGPFPPFASSAPAPPPLNARIASPPAPPVLNASPPASPVLTA